MKLHDFFSAFYGDLGGYLVLWRSDTKGSVWSSSLDFSEAEKFAELAHRLHFDAYFGVCLQASIGPGRGDAAGVSVVPGLWADIDFAGKPGESEAARRKNYPTREAAEKALSAMPCKPTVVVESGGGWHAYWLFDRPFVVQTEDDRARIAGMVKSWQGLLKAKLMKLGGFGLDSTHDLARVLRIPGTPNTKHTDGKCTSVLSFDSSMRHTVDDFASWLERGIELPVVAGAPAPAAPKPSKPPVASLSLTHEADPPGTKLVNLMEASSDFKRLWEGQIKRSSPSEYDMSLANYAINAGWTDAEAASLLVAFARKWNPSHIEKLLRVNGGKHDYLELTISKAHDHRMVSAQEKESEAAVDELAMEVRQAAREGRDPSRAVVLDKVSKSLGVQVVGFIQTGRREESYSLVVQDHGRKREVAVGSAAAIHSTPQKVVERIMAECGRHVVVSPKLKKEWAAIVSGLISIREFHDLAELELGSRVSAIVEEHLARKSGGWWVTDSETKGRRAAVGDPFVEAGKLYVYGPALKRIAHEIDRSVSGADLYIGLRSINFIQVTIAVPNRKTSRSYWCGSADSFNVAADPERSPVAVVPVPSI